jgi:PKD repeat protein/subtilisin family serine protease
VRKSQRIIRNSPSASFSSQKVELLMRAKILSLSLCLSLLFSFPGGNITPARPVEASASGPQLHLHRASFDARTAVPQSPAQVWTETAPGAHAIIQLHGPVTQVDRKALLATGIALLEYLPDYAYLVRGAPAQLAKAARLPQIYARTDFTLADKLSPALLDAIARGTDTFGWVRVVGWHAATPTMLVSALDTVGLDSHFMADSDTLLQAARLEAVRWIEPVTQPRVLNDVARTLMGVDPIWQNHSLFGTGQIVAIADSGLDTGDMATLSPDFAGRIVATHVLSEGGHWDDNMGHGTHVAGSVAGAGVQSGANPSQHAYMNSYAGVAPEAGLVIQAFEAASDGSVTGLPEDYYQIFAQAYVDGARIHSNSWGGTSGPVTDTEAAYGGYTYGAQRTDEFVWQYPDMAIFFAAGNSGADGTPSGPFGFCTGGNGVVDPDSLLTPGTSKNVITVGATENQRLSGGLAPMPWLLLNFCFTTEPISTDTISDDPNGMAAFSSRGPVDDGRIKPDLVAPGTNIISNRSHHPDATTLWGAHETNPDYVYSGGTSMATPLTAGAGALVRQWLQMQGFANPSAALLKATLLNTTVNIAPGQYGTGATQEIPFTRPNSVAGWGRTSLDFIDASAPYLLWLDDHSSGLNTDDVMTYTHTLTRPLEVLTNTLPLRVMLTWTDPPASLSAATQLVNDLDLRVGGPGGALYYGNEAVGGDRLNNVEGVIIPSPAPGMYTVTIQGFNIPIATQPYALAVSGPLVDAATLVSPTASFVSSSPDWLTEVTVFTNTTTGSPPLTYVWDFGDGMTSTLASPTHTYTQAGLYTVTLTATNAAGTDVATDTVIIALPAAPTAAFLTSSPNVLGTTTVFTNITSGAFPMQFVWDFGDGITGTWVAPTHNYTAIGVYTVTLTATNLGGSDVATDTVTIVPPPAPVAAFTTSSPDWLGETTLFTNTSTGVDLTYAWDFGDGLTSTLASPTHTYTTYGTYIVTLTVRNLNGTDIATDVVDILLPAPVASFVSSTPDFIGETTHFTNTTTGTATAYQWDFGDRSPWSTTTHPTHTYTAVGTYTVALTATNMTGSSVATHTVVIAPLACVPASDADFSFTPLTATLETLLGALVTFTGTATGTVPLVFTWDFGDNTTGAGATLTHLYMSMGMYTVTLTVNNLCGQVTATYTLTVVAPPEVTPYLVYLPLVLRGESLSTSAKSYLITPTHAAAPAPRPGCGRSRSTW